MSDYLPARNPWYATASDVLTRLTRDMSAAVEHATDADTRGYAFGLAHLVRDLTDTLTQAAWTAPETAGKTALTTLRTHAEHAPEAVPAWVRDLAPRWP